ncbi:hypothetical protein PRIPAC_84355 [Pristionchus pacificus]|uniref:Uncharacterized protein n=1 Tax=Pristionchus pacificus TaxID=54126 RepID=A0A2A6BTP4_PRIPA|nr:hypothetical protein PRIPAC_84355 [Pristionchus pacificus]|eukprot:PDM69131.1 hypothetical protein PRIPAC_47433 [Pristionchus pacificus]
MSWKYGEDLDKETIEKEEEELRNFVFDEISPVHAFNNAYEYISNHAKTGSIMPNISDAEAIVAINASGKALTLLVGEQEDIDEDTLDSIKALSSALEQVICANKLDDDTLSDYKELHDHAMALLRSLHGMFSYRAESDVEEFKEQVHNIKRNPYSICTNVMDFLKCDEKNPLILLLNASPFKTNKAMRSWSLCIIDLLVGMGIAYIVHEGVKGRDFTTFAQLQELSPIYDLNREIMTFNQSYKVDFWPELVRTLIEETADNNEEAINSRMAEILDIKLSQISNFDYGFLIIVHNEASGENEHIFITEEHNVLYKFNRSGRCILVYRTCFHKTRTAEEVEAMCTQAQEKKQELFCGPEDKLKDRVLSFFHANPNAGFKLNADVRLICADRHKQALVSMDSTCVRSKTWGEIIADFGSGFVSEDAEIIVLPRQEPGNERGENYKWFTSKFDD